MRVDEFHLQARRAFTILEMLLAVFAILVLIAIIVPSLNYAKRQAEIAHTQSLLNSISTGIEAYYNTTEFGKTFPDSMPGTFGSGAGQVAVNRGSVMLAEALTGFLPYEADGAGYMATGGSAGTPFTYNSVSDPVYGFRLHSGGHGTIYPPLVRTDDAKTFRVVPNTVITGPVSAEHVFIDRWGNEILYYRAVPATIKKRNGLHDQPRQITSVFAHWNPGTPKPPDETFTGIFVIEDNPYVKDASGTVTINLDPSTATDPKFWSTLGCSAANAINPGDNVVGADGYLLLSAGPDGIYFTADDIVQVRK